MSVAYTLALLETAIKNNVEDQGADFDDNIEDIIQRGEERCVRDLNLEIWKVVAAIVVVAGARTVSKPTGYLEADSLSSTLSGSIVSLDQKTYDYCTDYAPIVATQADPKFFAELNETQFYIVPTPNAALAAAGLSCRYLKKPNSIVTDTAGTWLSLHVGDLLLASCLIAADEFGMVLKAEGLGDRYEAYGALLASARIQFKHLMTREYAPVAAQPEAKGEG